MKSNTNVAVLFLIFLSFNFWSRIGVSQTLAVVFSKDSISIIEKNKFNVRIQVTLSELDSAISIIEISKNGTICQTIYSEGKTYSIALDFNTKYFIKCSKKGYTTKIIFFDTAIPIGREKNEFADFKVNVGLENEVIGNFVDSDNPVGGVEYDSKIHDFEKAGNVKYSGGYIAWRYFEEGMAKSKRKKYKEAMKCFTKAIELDSNYADAYLERGDCEYQLFYNVNSLQDYNKGIELDSSSPVAYSGRGIIKLSFNDYSGALQDFSKAIELSPSCGDYYNRGIAKDELKDYYGAIHDYSKAIEFDSNDKDVYHQRGFSKLKLGDKKGACADWTKAVELGDTTARKLLIEYCK